MKKENALDKSELIYNFMSLCNEGRKLLTLGKYEDVSKSLRCFQDALPVSQELYNNQNHPNIAKVLYCMGFTYRKLGGADNHLKALDFHRQALKMRQSCYKDIANAEIADSLASLGETYGILGDKVKGLEFLNKALEMRQKLYPGQVDLTTINFLLNIANAHCNLGSDADLNKSLDLLEQALSMARSLDGEQPNMITADILNNISINHQRFGGGADNLNKALAYLRESLDIHQKVAPNISSALATTLNNIGALYYKLSAVDIENKQQHLEYHLQYTQKALNMNQELYGDHPHHALARSMQDLSVAYINKGSIIDMKQAYQLQKQALTVYQKLYAADHPNVLECLNSLNYIKSNLESYNHIFPDHYSSEAQLSNTQIMDKDNEHFLSQNLDKDSTNLMGNISLDKNLEESGESLI